MGLNEYETARALAAPVGLLGGWFMASKATYTIGAELGFEGMAFYYLGRGAALGDPNPAAVASSMTFFPAPLVERRWLEGRAVMEPAKALAAFSECCWGWGRRRFARAAALERTVDLLARVVDGADGSALVLFAGWRQAPRPDGDLPALTAHLLHLLREFRGGMHGVAVLASGLTPVEAAVASATDFYRPQSVGWTEPLPELTEELLEKRQRAEDLTDSLVAPAFAVLTADERAELVELVSNLATAPKTG